MKPAIGEDKCLQISFQELLGNARRFMDIAAADAEVAIHNRWIVEKEKLLSRWRAIFGDALKIRFRQAMSQLRGVGDGGGTRDELGIGAVEVRYAAESPQDVSQVATEHSTIGVQ